MPEIINLSSFTYELPEERIAKFPPGDRSSSKLLYYNKGKIEHFTFRSIPDLLPDNASLYFNNTRVIPARISFRKETGGLIEIFLLHPLQPSQVMPVAMEAGSPVVWKCMIGNAKKWKSEVLHRTLKIGAKEMSVRVEKVAEDQVRFSWEEPAVHFADLVEAIGQTPLPPYLNREPTEADKLAYQTVYSENQGAVAAPTAGLHFTDELLDTLRRKGLKTHFLTLHVSAGTFQPIKTETVTEHNMHSEQIVIRRENVLQLLEKQRFCVAVGTTSLRTLESVFWYGVKLLQDPQTAFFIPKLFPYEYTGPLPGNEEVLKAVLSKMDESRSDVLTGTTEIFIFPGYNFRLVRGLITNFHQPQSTLILLVAAFAGNDWKKIYKEALDSNYRFLSYGDSSLLIPSY